MKVPGRHPNISLDGGSFCVFFFSFDNTAKRVYLYDLFMFFILFCIVFLLVCSFVFFPVVLEANFSILHLSSCR